MKVSISWLKELVALNVSTSELIDLLPLKSISLKSVNENYFELDMKGYNRSDLLSLRGVAREISALTKSKLLFQEFEQSDFTWSKQKFLQTKVKVANSQSTPFYSLAKIEGIKVGKSPESWVKKLTESGMRSVNNVTDVTNLIMLEFGQPLHAFDAKTVKDEEVTVRLAKKGERIITLDGKTRDLEISDLLIADPSNPLGIAGVMGGKDSEIGQSTSTILLEAAIFNPINIRQTATRLGLNSEAAKRFQHGLTKKRLLQALDAAIRMYRELEGEITAVNFSGDFEDQKRTIILTHQKMDELIGIKIPLQQAATYLQNLGFYIKDSQPNLWEIIVPYWRLDVNIEEDIIEEVARMYGYEKIPAHQVNNSRPFQPEEPIFKNISALREILVSLGLTEVQTYSFYSSQVLANLDLLKKESLLRVANPISAETQFLKDNTWPNLLEAVVKNVKKGFADIAIFEIGKVFYLNEKKQPTEKYSLSIALMNNTDNPLAELYEILNRMIGKLKLKITAIAKQSEGEYFHPRRFMQISTNNKVVGEMAEVHKRITDKFGLDQRVAILEISLSELT